MIVLEATLDLKLERAKISIIVKSFLIALVILIITSFSISYILILVLKIPFYNSLIYAVTLSIMSSAIIISSVTNLEEDKKEFLIYESTFSDILGIMFFYYLVDFYGRADWGQIGIDISLNVIITFIISLIVAYLLVALFHRVTLQGKLFLIAALLILLYSIGKLFHLSSLLIILFFGIILNNQLIFFKGPLKRWIKSKVFDEILEDFKILIAESSFIVRTLFFVLFGMSISIANMDNYLVIISTFSIIAVLYLIRYLNLKVFSHTSIFPELFIAPRGLITVLLFFSIPHNLQSAEFKPAILLLVILITNIIMMIALIKKGKPLPPVIDRLEKKTNFPNFSLFKKQDV
jgi:NhaP-type Na+/H+ or K+/H+ antiporter